VDENNRKMSKSIGNVIEPRQAINGIPNKLPQCGLDVLRFWIAHEYYKPQIQIGSNILEKFLKRTFEIRSILRFLVGNLSDLNVENLNLIDYELLLPIDKYILNSLNSLLESVTDSYQDMNLNKVVTLIEIFYLTNLSSFYIKSVKDRLYCEKKDSFERKSCQTALYYVLIKSLVMIGPVMPHLAEEAFCYSFLKQDKSKNDDYSLFRSDLNFEANPNWNNSSINNLFKIIDNMRDKFFDLIQSETASQFEINLEISKELNDLIMTNYKQNTKWLIECFGCSKLNIKKINDSNGLEFLLQANKITNKFICQRCRMHSSSNKNELCERCSNALV
jgi:isoleucyl-tRNA synthetase